jgi:hypothetical protein
VPERQGAGFPGVPRLGLVLILMIAGAMAIIATISEQTSKTRPQGDVLAAADR